MRGDRLRQLVTYVLAGMIGLGLWVFSSIYVGVQRIRAIFWSGKPSSPTQENETATDDDKRDCDGAPVVLQNVSQTPSSAPPADRSHL